MRLDWLLPEIKGIPVLMYHHVGPGLNNALCITPDKLKEQWLYLKNEGYETLSLIEFLDVINCKTPLREKSVLLSFDDGYYNNLLYAYPLLQELNWQATMFIVGDTLDGTHLKEEKEINRRLSIADLKLFDHDIIQLALHGYHHLDFSSIGLNGIRQEIEQSINAFDNSGLRYHKVLAYPYGARPLGKKLMQLKNYLSEAGIEAAFRIGNQIAKIPCQDIYEIKRIDIKGTDTLDDFKIKIRKGKLYPF